MRVTFLVRVSELELDVGSELEQTLRQENRIARSGDGVKARLIGKRLCSVYAPGRCSATARREQSGIQACYVQLVKQVEHFCGNLKLHAFANLEAARDLDVRIENHRETEGVASDERNAAGSVCTDDSERSAGTAAADATGERQSGGDCLNGSDRPTVKDPVSDLVRIAAGEELRLIDDRGEEALANVEHGVTAILCDVVRAQRRAAGDNRRRGLVGVNCVRPSVAGLHLQAMCHPARQLDDAGVVPGLGGSAEFRHRLELLVRTRSGASRIERNQEGGSNCGQLSLDARVVQSRQRAANCEEDAAVLRWRVGVDTHRQEAAVGAELRNRDDCVRRDLVFHDHVELINLRQAGICCEVNDARQAGCAGERIVDLRIDRCAGGKRSLGIVGASVGKMV